jgi:hypothetical protein
MEIVAVARKGNQLRASYATLQVPVMRGGRNHVLLAAQDECRCRKYSAAAETDRRGLLVVDRSPDPSGTAALSPRIGKEVLVDGQGAGAQ